MDKLAEQIEAKRTTIDSRESLSEVEWAANDAYNLGLTEAAELVRSFSAGHSRCEVDYD
jgi:hypothetical protein